MALSVPTLVLHRTGVRTFPPRCGRDLASLISGSELVLLPGKEHNLWQGEPQPALDAVGAFLGIDLGRLPAAHGSRAAQTGGPIGLGAVLFTDVVASTATTNRLGDDLAQALLHLHNRIVRDASGEPRVPGGEAHRRRDHGLVDQRVGRLVPPSRSSRLSPDRRATTPPTRCWR